MEKHLRERIRQKKKGGILPSSAQKKNNRWCGRDKDGGEDRRTAEETNPSIAITKTVSGGAKTGGRNSGSRGESAPYGKTLRCDTRGVMPSEELPSGVTDQ